MTDTTENTNSFTMPSSATDRKEIKDKLHEMGGYLQIIADRRQDIKDTCEVLAEKYGISKKIANKMAKVLHDNTYNDVAEEADQFSTIFETLFQDNTV